MGKRGLRLAKKKGAPALAPIAAPKVGDSSLADAASGVRKPVQASDESAKRQRVGESEKSESRSQPAISVGGGSALNVDECWVARGLVVRVISQQSPLRDFYGTIASVLEVDQSKMWCRIKARKGDKTHVLQDVRVQDLETRVSRDCKSVRVVRGKQKGTVAKLVKRDADRGVALVRIDDVESE